MIAHPQTALPETAGPVLLFDGGCGLCQRVVRRLLQLDRDARLRFAPLQGPAAQAFLRARGLPTVEFDTLIFASEWPVGSGMPYLTRTDGVIAALRATGRRRARALATALAIFPRVVRDAAYRGVARWRYRLFGPWRAAAALPPEWRERFLD